MKRRLLWVGHVLTETGYSRVSENLLPYFLKDWDVAVLGVGYDGDPHGKPYRIYRADRRGDPWGVNRLHEVIVQERPSVICLIGEPWTLMAQIQEIRIRMRNAVKIVGYCVVDGENMKAEHAEWLTQLDVCIFPTQFALDQAKQAEYNGYWFIVPHGLDPTVYKPCNQQRARQIIGLGNVLGPDAFVFGNVNENQPRKRIDLTVAAWSRWFFARGKPANAYLYIHANKNSPVGWDLGQMAKHHGIRGHIVAPAEDVRYGEASMKYVYNALNVQFTTSMGEGWGFTTMEGMACGVPQLVPTIAALGEWTAGVALPVDVDRTRPLMTNQQQNVLMYAPTVDSVAAALDVLWSDPQLRERLGQAGRRLVLGGEFRWSHVAAGFEAAFQDAMEAGGVSKEFLVEESLAGPSGGEIKA